MIADINIATMMETGKQKSYSSAKRLIYLFSFSISIVCLFQYVIASSVTIKVKSVISLMMLGWRNTTNYGRSSIFIAFNRLSKYDSSTDTLLSSSFSVYLVSSDIVSDRDVDYEENHDYIFLKKLILSRNDIEYLTNSCLQIYMIWNYLSHLGIHIK